MNRYLALTLTCASLATVVACGGSSDDKIPNVICGTKIDTELSGPLLEPLGKFHEYNRVDRKEAQTAPCIILIDDERALQLRFAWHSGSPGDLVEIATDSSVTHLTEPTRVDLGFQDSVVGNEGAMATTLCKSPRGDHFTLGLTVPRAQATSPELRPAIEKFMRAYMTATVKSLGCAGG
ncbi:hypothetical protein ACWGI8_06100 [Streptomyces sp. NPDC054841]